MQPLLKIFSSFLLFILFNASLCSAKKLPEPYRSLKNVLPFDSHGWYQNSAPLEELFQNTPGIRIVVEVGSLLGCSTRHIASLLPKKGKIYAIDHWNGSIEHQPGQSAYHTDPTLLYEQFLSNVIHANLTKKIIPIRMTSLKAAKKLRVKPDVVYLDAAHDTESVLQDLEAWFLHVKGRGILCGDDYCWPSVAVAVNQFAKAHNVKVEVAPNGAFWRLCE